MAQARSRLAMNSASSAAVDVNALQASPILVNWQILNFKHALAVGLASEQFQHDSLPGIFWAISVIAQESRVKVFLLLSSVSIGKSDATIATARYSISLAPGDGSGTPVSLRLASRVFSRNQCYHRIKCSATQSEQLMRYDSIIVSGEITVRLPVSTNSISRRMYESGMSMSTDLLIKTEQRTFRVHKAVLYEACPAILDLLAPGQVELEITSTSAAVTALLQYVYGDELSFVGHGDLACAVLELAANFNLAPLKQMCESALIVAIDGSNAVRLAGLASKTDANVLRNRVFEYAASNVDGLVFLGDWTTLKADLPLMAMSFCESIIEGLFVETNQQVMLPETPKLSAVTAHLEVPVRWEIPDFQNLMENSLCGFSIACKQKFSHVSMPGIVWELIMYPNGKKDYSHHVALFMRPILTSNKKSQATAPSGGYSLRFEPTVNANDTSAPPPEQILPVQQFSLKSELGIAQFAHQLLVDKHCFTKDESVALVGKILIEPPPCDQALFSRRLFESSKRADFMIKIDEESFAVHKNILSEASPAMEAMFDMDCKESKNNSMVIKESTVEAVRALLQFWYGDPLCFDGLEELAMDVYKFAGAYTHRSPLQWLSGAYATTQAANWR